EIYAAHYLQAGADGFVSKIKDEKLLLTMIRKMLSEGKFFKKEEINEVLITNNFSELSASEQRVMYLLIQGKYTKEIASDLNLKVSTISTYKSRIFEKLNVGNVIDLIKRVEIEKNLN
ncbi:LuxR C-terminal-related transcriptional regulator, partial [Propionicimonas sp. T2.31MG-18]|uniref:LuxR C-terminal-related transcriptional regulator n=1 Tax=Propionicimonas sp. T2.31MG-18 TaxID=3157620 RepID=UPI0036706E0F